MQGGLNAPPERSLVRVDEGPRARRNADLAAEVVDGEREGEDEGPDDEEDEEVQEGEDVAAPPPKRRRTTRKPTAWLFVDFDKRSNTAVCLLGCLNKEQTARLTMSLSGPLFSICSL